MELHQAYHEIRMLQIKVNQYKLSYEKEENPEIKAAYSTIQSVHTSTLSGLQTNIVYTISSLIGLPS